MIVSYNKFEPVTSCLIHCRSAADTVSGNNNHLEGCSLDSPPSARDRSAGNSWQFARSNVVCLLALPVDDYTVVL